MSFARVNPGSWGTLSTLTSAQANQLDIDHANALDKTTAGDTLAGVVGMAATAALDVNSAGAMVQAQVANGINTNIASGIVSGVAAGIALGGGSSDYPTFTNSTGSTAAPRSFSRCVPLIVTAFTRRKRLLRGDAQLHGGGRSEATMTHEILDRLRTVLSQPCAEEGKWNHGAHLFVALSTARSEAHDHHFREGSVPEQITKTLTDRAADAEAFLRSWEFA